MSKTDSLTPKNPTHLNLLWVLVVVVVESGAGSVGSGEARDDDRRQLAMQVAGLVHMEGLWQESQETLNLARNSRERLRVRAHPCTRSTSAITVLFLVPLAPSAVCRLLTVTRVV